MVNSADQKKQTKKKRASKEPGGIGWLSTIVSTFLIAALLLPVTNFIKPAPVKADSHQWIQTTQADFNAGFLTNVDIATSPGDVRLSSILGWYDFAWQYRKSHVVQSASGAGTNYQIRLIVHKGSGTDTGHNVYLDGHCEDDFRDIRFTGSDGTSELDYWMESYAHRNEATFWIEVTDDLDSSNATIYIYYGNSEASTTSNGADTFADLFTHFPGDSLPGGWIVDGDTVGSMVIENSLLKLTARKEASGSWLKRGVRTSSSVWTNDRALMFRIDSINYYPDATNRRRWFLGGEGGNFYLEFQSWGDKIRVRDWNLYDEYSPCDFAGGEVVWLAKESGNDGVAYYYIDGNLVDVLDNGLHPSHAFSDFAVLFNVQVGSNAMPDVDYTYIDWAAIRKFVYPEPEHGDWGDEEGQYFSPGTVASQVLDTGSSSSWSQLSWAENIPAGTDITFEVRASDMPFLNNSIAPSWTSVGGTTPVTTGLPSSRYMQWRATLTTTNRATTPTLSEVVLDYDTFDAPTIATNAATDIMASTATLNMDFDYKDAGSGSVQFAYKKTTEPGWGFTIWQAKSGSGSYSVPLSGLSAQTEYQFRARLKYDSTEIESPALDFNTLTAGPAQQVLTADGTGAAYFSTNHGDIINLTALANTPCGTLSGLSLPHGFFSFTITGIPAGSRVTITITLPSKIPAGAQYWECIGRHWLNATSLLGDNDKDNTLKLTLTDGGLEDADGLANGIIVAAPGGPTVVVAGSIHAPARASQTPPQPLNPAQLSVKYLSVNPEYTYANQPVTITTNVVNTGDESGNHNIALMINGQTIETRTVNVSPHTAYPLSFTVYKNQPGTYTVYISGKEAVFTVVGEGRTGGTGSPGGPIAVIVLAVLVIATGVVLAMAFRRRPV